MGKIKFNLKWATVSIIAVVSIFMVSVTACSDESDNLKNEPVSLSTTVEGENVEQMVQLMVLNAKIDSLNYHFNPDGYQARGLGLKGFFKKIVAVVVSDVVGGMVGTVAGPAGTVVGAILSSGLAASVPVEDIIIGDTLPHQSIITFMPTNDDALSSSLIPTQSDASTKEDSIGYYHNWVLIEVKKSLSEANCDLTVDTLIECIVDNTCKVYGLKRSAVLNELNKNENFYVDVMKRRYMATDQEDDLHAIMNNWRSGYPEYAGELTLIETFLEGLSNVDGEEEPGLYFKEAITLIDESSLDIKIKERLKSSFIVANASYKLWKTEQFKQ